MRFVRLSLFALAVGLSVGGPGLGPAAAEGIDDCDGPTPEMTLCIFQAYEEADADLNAVWDEVLTAIEESEIPADSRQRWHESLVAAQRAWVTFKEEDCNGAVAFEWFGGSGANAAVGACLYDKTVTRADDLRARYLEGR